MPDPGSSTLDPHAVAREAAEREVRPLLAADPITARLARATMTPVLGGLSNFSWRAHDTSGRSFFVRFAHRASEQLGADHANECRVLACVAAARIAPPVVRCDPRAGVLVTQWIETTPDVAGPPDEQRLGLVARTLATLHALGAPPGLRHVDFAVQARELEQRCDVSSHRALLAAATQVIAALAATAVAPVLCHNDLNPLNLLCERTGALWLVDWEYAGLGDPAIDLASYASQHGLDAARRFRLSQLYRAAGGVVEDARLEVARWVFDYVQWLWYRAALASDASLAGTTLARDRARRLARGLRRRARSLLRCNNASFAGHETTRV